MRFPWPSILLGSLLIILGAAVGTGVFTFFYAKGYSYLSNDPRACANCHVMNDAYDSWVKSSHRHAASCNDCHVPHGFPAKYFGKAENGWNHSKAFTLQNFPEPIRIRPHNLKVLQNNCVSCHETLVSDIAGHSGEGAAQRCTDCHRSVGHMHLS